MNFIKNIFSVFIVIAVILFVSCGVSHNKIPHKYYVSLEGSDASNGSMEAPFRTIKKGVSVLSASDTLVVKSGNYGHEYDINITASGTKENPIVIMAEKPGKVFLKGLRKEGEEDYLGEDGIVFGVLNSSNIVVDGFYISEYSVGVNIIGHPKEGEENPKNVVVKNCIFENNGEAGVQTSRADSTLISNCQFISDLVQKEDHIVSVQDYGCNFFNTQYSKIENSYFYGAHHQAVSFKEGNKNCIVSKNIFEGAQYTAIYLGQNRRADITPDNDNPVNENLIAEYNIVRPTKGFRVKSPLRVDNCKNAIVRYNYFEGFDETNNTGGINVWNEALGKIEVYNNILAFGRDNEYSAGVSLELGSSSDAEILIHNNTIYNVVQDVKLDRYRGDDTAGYSFENNISYKCRITLANKSNNFVGNPEFVNGNPVQQPILSTPAKPEFNLFYKKLTEPFGLKKDSGAEGFGVQFK